MTRAQMPPPTDPRPGAERPGFDSTAEILRQAIQGFLPPTDALFHLFDRMEMPR